MTKKTVAHFTPTDEQIQDGHIDRFDGVQCEPLPSKMVIDPLPFTKEEKERLERFYMNCLAMAFRIPPDFFK